MSQENVDLMRKAMDAYNRRDKAGWLALTDPDMEVVPPREWPESARILGREATWNFYVANAEAFGEGIFELVELIDAGSDSVVAHIRAAMRGKTSDASVSFSYWSVTTFRNGRGLRAEWFPDRAEALEAVGLPE